MLCVSTGRGYKGVNLTTRSPDSRTIDDDDLDFIEEFYKGINLTSPCPRAGKARDNRDDDYDEPDFDALIPTDQYPPIVYSGMGGASVLGVIVMAYVCYKCCCNRCCSWQQARNVATMVLPPQFPMGPTHIYSGNHVTHLVNEV